MIQKLGTNCSMACVPNYPFCPVAVMRNELCIIIVNYRSWKCLEACLKSLEHPQDRYDVLVVDNFSDDGQFESFAANYPQIKFVKSQTNLGFGGGCRLGAIHSSAEYILFLNPDTLAKYDAIDSMLQFLKSQNKYGIVSCKQHANLARHYLLFPNFWRLFAFLRGVEARMRARKFAIQRWRNFEFIVPDWVSASVLMISRRITKELAAGIRYFGCITKIPISASDLRIRGAE